MGNGWTKTNGTRRRAKSWAYSALAVAFLSPLASWAEGIPEPLWGSFGVVKILGHGTCNGILIANDRFLTAAHCVFDRDGEFVDPKKIWFENGKVSGQVQKNWRARELTLPSAYEFGRAFDLNGPDVAVVGLTDPIPDAIALPISLALSEIPNLDLGVSYQPTDGNGLIHQVCGLKSAANDFGVLDCVVKPGASGAAVIHYGQDGPILVGIIGKAGETTDGPVTIFAPVGQAFKTP